MAGSIGGKWRCVCALLGFVYMGGKFGGYLKLTLRSLERVKGDGER